MRRILFAAAVSWVFCVQVRAQDSTELLTRMKVMEERIKALEAEVATLKGQQPAAAASAPASLPATPAEAAQTAPPPAEQTPQPPAGPLPVYGGAAAGAAKVFNPDISVIGDFLGAVGNGGPRPTPALEMHESEVGLQAIVDPYARADFFLSFRQSGVELEEGFVTFPALPGGLQMRAGKMRAAFGKVNTLHNHALSWTDRPLVTQNLVAGEEGISDAGLAFARIIPAPKEIFLEATAQVFRGDSEGLFQSLRRSDVSAVGHLRGYRDISESTNLDLGFSYARGHSTEGESLINQLFGIDATVRWKPLRRSIYNSFVGRSEFIWARAQQPLSLVSRPFGYYISGDYQLARRWFLGARFDQSERLASAALKDTGGSLLLTYWPSEFSQIRGQLRRTRYAEQMTANEFLFQFQYSIGAHGAHPF